MGKGIVKLGEGQWAVKDGNLLAAKETNGRFKNAEFTVSRGTRASYVGRDGLIKESNLQDVNLVNNGDFSELGSELVTNGTFDTDSDWTLTGGWSIADNKLSCDGTNDSLAYQSLSSLNLSDTLKVTYTITDYTSGTLRIGTGAALQQPSGIARTSSGTYVEYITKTDGLSAFGFRSYSFNGSIDNIVVNEVDPNDYWTFSGDSFTFPDGAARIARTTSTTFIQQNVLTSGKLYKVEFDVLDKDDNNGTFIVRLGSNNVYDVSTYEGTRFSKYITSAGVDFRIYSSSDNGVIYVDNIVVSEVKTDTPRIDFTDNTDGHLLLEPQSTNLLTYSEDFSDSSWNFDSQQSYLTRTANAALSPSGNNDATKLISNNITTSPSTAYIAASTSASSPYTTSVFAKKGEYDYLVMSVGSYASGFWGSFNLSNGTVNTQPTEANTSASIESYGNGWYRCLITTTTTSGLEICLVSPSVDGTLTTNYTSTTNGIYIWGGQMEALSHSTSYIPTNGSTVTRDAETCTGAGSSADFNSEEGVLYVEISALANDGTFRMIGVSDSTENNKIDLYYRSNFDQITLRLISNGVQQIFEKFDITATNFSKMAFRYKSGESNLFIDGVKQKESNYPTVSMPIGLSELAFDNGAGTDNFYGKCKAIRVYKEALSDTDLENLTS